MTDTTPAPAPQEPSSQFSKADLLLLLDSAIGTMLSVKRVLEHTDLTDFPAKQRACTISRSGEHERVLWNPDGTGMCRDCGEPVERDSLIA